MGRGSLERKGSAGFLKEVVELAAAKLNLSRLSGFSSAARGNGTTSGGQFHLTMGGQGNLQVPRGAKVTVTGTVSRPVGNTGSPRVWTQATLMLTSGNQHWQVRATRSPGSRDIHVQAR